MQISEIQKVEKLLGVKFKNPLLLEQALTPYWSRQARENGGNRNLELLGDAILFTIIVVLLMEDFPSAVAMQYSNARSYLVSNKNLSQLAAEIGLGPYCEMSNPSLRSKPGDSLGDALEAIFGAIYQDSGWEECVNLARRIFTLRSKDLGRESPIAKLQRYIQKAYKPTDRVGFIDVTLPNDDHSTVWAVFQNDALAEGRGKNYRDAAHDAATNVLLRYNLWEEDK